MYVGWQTVIHQLYIESICWKYKFKTSGPNSCPNLNARWTTWTVTRQFYIESICWFTSIFTIHFRLTILPNRQVPFPLQPPHWSVTTSLFFWTNVPFPIFYFWKKRKILFWLKRHLNFLSWFMIISSLVQLSACLIVWNAFKNPEAWESELEITFFLLFVQVLKVFPFPMTITTFQFAIGTVLVLFMWSTQLYRKPKISSGQVLWLFWLIFSMCYNLVILYVSWFFKLIFWLLLYTSLHSL